MKKVWIALLAILLFCLFLNWYNSDPKIIISHLQPKIDAARGELRYRFYLFSVLPLGEAVLSPAMPEDFKGQAMYHLEATARPLKIYSKFFNGYAIFDSYVDVKTLSPVLFKQKLISPGKEEANKEVTYDQKQGIMYLKGVMRQILPNTQDPISLILNLRRMDFNQVESIDMNINTNQKNYMFRGFVHAKEIFIKDKGYKIAYLKAEVRRRDKNPYHKSDVQIVLLTGKENIPILIRVFASGILINAKLVDIR